MIMLASFPKMTKTAFESPENRHFRLPHCRLTSFLQGISANIRINLTFHKLESLGYIFVADSMGLSSFEFLWWSPKDARVLKQGA